MCLTAVRFIGSGSFLTAGTAAALSQLPPEKVRIGSGLLNLAQNGLGGTLGLAIGTTFLQYRLTVQDAQVEAMAPDHLSQQAAVAAYQDCFVLLTILGLASLALLIVLLRKPIASSPRP
jgi:MFS family permease